MIFQDRISPSGTVSMFRLIPLNFTDLGRPEYILAKAGLYHVVDSPQGYVLQNGKKLIRLFDHAVVPPPETLVPVLVEIVETCNSEMGGALDMRSVRDLMIEALKELGMSHKRGAISQMFDCIGEAAKRAAMEMVGTAL